MRPVLALFAFACCGSAQFKSTVPLVVTVQASANSGAVIDKVGGSGILFTQRLAADAGETRIR